MNSYGGKRNLVGLVAACCLAGLPLLACRDDSSVTGPSSSTSPQPGQLTVAVSGGTVAGQAFLLRVSGPDPTDPVASGNDLLYTSIAGDTLRAAVMGAGSDGDLIRFAVPDVDAIDRYNAVLLQVSDAGNDLLTASDYTIQISR